MDHKTSPYRAPSRRVASVVAVTACAAGFAIVFVLGGGTGPAPAAASGSATPPVSSSPSALGPLLQISLTGKVLKVSGTAITIGGDGPPVTARLTGSTKVTGKITSIGGIKAGDEISAQLTGASTSTLMATAIQDPG